MIEKWFICKMEKISRPDLMRKIAEENLGENVDAGYAYLEEKNA